MIREKSAGVIIYRKHPTEGLQYLLLYMGNNYWNFSKGHIEEGESETEAAVREVSEETGLHHINLVPDFRQQTHFFFKQERDGNSELIKKDFILYLAQVPHNSKIDITNKIGEHETLDGYCWMDFKNACKYLKFKNLKQILEEADYFINQGNKEESESS